jgi:ribosomal protein S14
MRPAAGIVLLCDAMKGNIRARLFPATTAREIVPIGHIKRAQFEALDRRAIPARRLEPLPQSELPGHRQLQPTCVQCAISQLITRSGLQICRRTSREKAVQSLVSGDKEEAKYSHGLHKLIDIPSVLRADRHSVRNAIQ